MKTSKFGDKLSSVEEKINARLDKFNDKIGKRIFTARASAIVVTAFMVCVGTGIAHVQTTAYEVLYNGQSIGYVKDQSTFDNALGELQQKLSKEYGNDNVIIADDIKLKPARTMGEKLDVDQCAETIYNAGVDVKLKGAAIMIDGKAAIQTDSKETAEKALNDFKKQYAQVEGATVLSSELKQNVTIDEQNVEVPDAKNYDVTMSYLKEGNEITAQTTVQPGETDGNLIAANRGTTVDRLAAMNADKDLNALKEGDVLNTTQKSPVLTVVTIVEKQYQEEIPFETEEQPTDELMTGEEEKIQKGENGQKDVDAVFTYENGQEVGKEVKSENTTKEPVKAVKRVGTKEAAAAPVSRGSISGSGQFLIPTSGLVGEIGRPGGGSSNHSNGCAVDILNSYGTPVYASAAGTVTRASSFGGYGNCIEIQHEGGYSTLYGHLSSIDVSVGQTVGQGEYIGGTGSTGSSTANHLHFEVKIGGVAQLIQDYIPVSSGAYV